MVPFEEKHYLSFWKPKTYLVLEMDHIRHLQELLKLQNRKTYNDFYQLLVYSCQLFSKILKWNLTIAYRVYRVPNCLESFLQICLFSSCSFWLKNDNEKWSKNFYLEILLKVAFFRKCDEIFWDLQISKKNVPKRLSWVWNLSSKGIALSEKSHL